MSSVCSFILLSVTISLPLVITSQQHINMKSKSADTTLVPKTLRPYSHRAESQSSRSFDSLSHSDSHRWGLSQL